MDHQILDRRDPHNFLDFTRLVEEVPYIDPGEQYYIWHDHKVVWHGPTKDSGEEWAAANGITIERFEPYEP